MIWSISRFRNRLTALLAVKRGVYSGARQEIQDVFRNATIEEIRANRDMILIADDHIFVKLRIPDHKRRLSKRDGYRLIYMVYKQVDRVVLLDVYPKNGPLQQLSITDNDLADMVEMYLVESREGRLEPFDIGLEKIENI